MNCHEGTVLNESSHASPRDCASAGTVDFEDEYVMQGGKIARLGNCTVCGRRFERVWLHSHDQCFKPENQEVHITPRPH